MGNRDIQAARRYHEGTKHPDGFLMDPYHRFDPSRQPLLFKRYLDLEKVPLSLDDSPLGVPALAAIAGRVEPSGKDSIPDLKTLTRLLYYSAGVTKRISRPWGQMAFRAAACTGALYHIELYLVCGDLPGLEAGVYHFDPLEMTLDRLRQGDYRRLLVEASGGEPALAHAPAALVCTDVFWRNACKYQAREYRHAFWDSGTMLSHTLAMASAHRLPAEVVLGFADEAVNRLLALDTRREVSLALLPVGALAEEVSGSAPEIEPLSSETMAISEREVDFPAIRAVHQASSLASGEGAAAWRQGAFGLDPELPSGDLIPLEPHPAGQMPDDGIEAIIVRRGSTRRFARRPISFQELSTALIQSTQGIPADYLAPYGAALAQPYLIVHAVEGLPPGAYLYHRERRALQQLKEGDFRGVAGMLGLHQALAADASANIYFLTDLDRVLERLGDRGYRAAQLDASLTAGKIYLAAYAQGFGATGLTFFDDAVTEFFGLPHAEGMGVMFLIALGVPAKRVGC